jgi:dUTP pyrophosphatase
MTRIIFEALHDGVEPPQRATAGSAGYDLRANLVQRTLTCSDGTKLWTAETGEGAAAAVTLEPGQMALIPLGFKARLPEGFEAQVRPRSGASFKRGIVIPNAPGTIDADYPDEWMVPVRNGTAQSLRIEHGERIAQVILQRYEVMDWTVGVVAQTTERAGGFGSTGH